MAIILIQRLSSKKNKPNKPILTYVYPIHQHHLRCEDRQKESIKE